MAHRSCVLSDHLLVEKNINNNGYTERKKEAFRIRGLAGEHAKEELKKECTTKHATPV